VETLIRNAVDGLSLKRRSAPLRDAPGTHLLDHGVSGSYRSYAAHATLAETASLSINIGSYFPRLFRRHVVSSLEIQSRQLAKSNGATCGGLQLPGRADVQ